MKGNLFILVLIFLVGVASGNAQQITYSEPQKQDTRDINFEILGKVGDNYIVYKNIRWKHVVQVLNKDMETIENNRLDFVPEKTFNIDFVTYTDYFFMVYQYQKNNTIYCKGVKMSAAGKEIGEPIDLDTTRVGLLSDNKIYGMSFSEDKQKILLYKLHPRHDQLHIMTKRFDNNLQMIDSVRNIVPFDNRRDVYTRMQIANDGTVVYIKQYKAGNRENINNLEFFTMIPGLGLTSQPISLGERYIDEVKIKIDNLNKRFLVNSFSYTRKNGMIDGLFSALVSDKGNVLKTYFNTFSDSLRARISNTGQYRFAFDNLFLRDIFLKKDGSYLLVAEDYSAQTRSNAWNRWDYLYNYPNSYNSYYYQNNYRYPGYYRPYSNFQNASTRYAYENILVSGIDSTLKMQWDNVIYKKQSDEETDNFLSYSNMNSGSEIHFLFIEKERNAQVISNQAISPTGGIQRYATLKSREKGYMFMPRLGKQVGIRQVIIPALYRGNIVFAKVDFSMGQS